MNPTSLAVGGQAVMEGVMMRSPRGMAVAVRKSNQKILIRELKWKNIFGTYKFLKWPVVRGAVTLIEAMFNGMSALAFSAEVASIEEQVIASSDGASPGNTQIKREVLTKAAIAGAMVIAFGFGIFVFVVLPHLLTVAAGQLIPGGLSVDTFLFHVVDGVIKAAIFLGYIFIIGQTKDIRRVFQYHGAEHKSIFNHEKGLLLSVENAAKQTRLHPRCGTAFALTAILFSIVFFSIVFPFIPKPPGLSPAMASLFFALIKIPMMLPIMGLSYEFLRATSKDSCPVWMKQLSRPGLVIQYLTTREPDASQLEVALASLRTTLWREKNPDLELYERDLEVSSALADDFETQLLTLVKKNN